MKKLFAFGLAVCLTVAMSATALAADGDEATSPDNSSHNATVTDPENDGMFNTTGDDDTLPVGGDTNGADIYVWAKVTDVGSTVYKVDVAWGAMEFEFNSASAQWNPSTHDYDGTGTPVWTADYLNGENNKITVTNHSNYAIDAAFSYAAAGTAFNANSAGDDAVVGNFFADNDKAKEAAKQLHGTHTLGTLNADPNALADSKIILNTADKFTIGDNETPVGERSGDVFFAFSGTPDAGKSEDLANFTKVGVITVTVTPDDTVQNTYDTVG